MTVRVEKSNFNFNSYNVTAIPDHYVALPAQISATHAIEEDGRKVIKGGLCVIDATDNDKRKTGVTPLAAPAEGAELGKFNGVVFTDVEVPYGETMVNVPLLLHGFVKEAALVKVGNAIPESATDAIIVVR